MSPTEEPLRFGTAGLRGPLGDGPGHMNVDTVAHATAGVAAWLRAHERSGSVVVGRDARHGSTEFAATTAEVFAAAGFDVHWFDEPLPTPVVAFAVRHLGAVAGVVITASHNPAGDNGYKLYLGDGAQIVPPVDGEIEALIDTARVAPPPERRSVAASPGAPLVAAYLAGAAAVVQPGGPRRLRIVATAMHGVGAPVLRAALTEAGFDPPIEVAAQAEPDPDFPTVAFPNPEEPGALDLALALAAAEGADLVLANDPDADRLAVAVPTGAGGWRALSGDEVGGLLADHLLRRRPPGPDDVVATTVVSSRLLQAMAAAAGVPYVETLTGFKWVTRAAGPDRRLLFGYEEALGYSVTDLVRDKDGITAALVLAELAALERAVSRTLLDRLDDLHRRFAAHHTAQRSLRVEGADWLDRVTATMASLRAQPPDEIDGRAVVAVEDLLTGERLPPSDVLIWQLEGLRLVVRPSGTEPKLKCYAEAVVPVAGGDLEAARADARSAVEAALAATSSLLGERGLRD